MPNNESHVTRIYNRTDDKINLLAEKGFIPSEFFRDDKKQVRKGDAAIIDFLIDQLMGFIELGIQAKRVKDMVQESPETANDKQSIPES